MKNFRTFPILSQKLIFIEKKTFSLENPKGFFCCIAMENPFYMLNISDWKIGAKVNTPGTITEIKTIVLFIILNSMIIEKSTSQL